MNVMMINMADCEPPPEVVTTTREELLSFLREMSIMRRVEITNDTEYKVRHHDAKGAVKAVCLYSAVFHCLIDTLILQRRHDSLPVTLPVLQLFLSS